MPENYQRPAATADEAAVEPQTDDAIVEPQTDDAIVEPPTDDAVVEPPTDDAVVEPPTDDAVVEPPTDDAVVEPPTDDEPFCEYLRSSLTGALLTAIEVMSCASETVQVELTQHWTTDGEKRIVLMDVVVSGDVDDNIWRLVLAMTGAFERGIEWLWDSWNLFVAVCCLAFDFASLFVLFFAVTLYPTYDIGRVLIYVVAIALLNAIFCHLVVFVVLMVAKSTNKPVFRLALRRRSH